MDNTSRAYHPLRSQLLSQVIQAEPQRCWRNAVMAVALFPSLFAGGCYVEGWAVVPRAQSIDLLEHGWCCTPHVLLDPTLVLSECVGHPLFFPGVEIPAEELAQRTYDQVLPLVCHSEWGSDGMLHSAYKAAYEQAWRTTRVLAQEQQKVIKTSRRSGQIGGLTILSIE